MLESDGVTPVAHAFVFASDPGIGFCSSPATAADGTYTIQSLASGSYRVQVDARNQGFVFECFKDDLLCQNPTLVAVALGADTPNIDFTLEVGGTISGTVLESDGVTPVANAFVFASDPGIGSGKSTATAADGT